MKYTTKIRYSELLQVDDFITEDSTLEKGSLCVVHTERGVEVGTVLLAPEPLKDQGSKNTQKYVLKILEEKDYTKIEKIQEKEKEKYDFARKRIEDRGMAMKLSKVEQLFDQEKIIFYFLAEGRVDFRGLVKDLAKQYKTRIEMRQIGTRDESRLLGIIGHCGQKLCCTRFLKDFKPVSMKMAKNQKATLDPKKISGVCGKLLCCLRYEDQQYTEALSNMSGIGAIVKVKEGTGEVIGLDPMEEKISIYIEKKGKITIPYKDIIKEISPAPEEAQRGRKNSRKNKKAKKEQEDGSKKNKGKLKKNKKN